MLEKVLRSTHFSFLFHFIYSSTVDLRLIILIRADGRKSRRMIDRTMGQLHSSSFFFMSGSLVNGNLILFVEVASIILNSDVLSFINKN